MRPLVVVEDDSSERTLSSSSPDRTSHVRDRDPINNTTALTKSYNSIAFDQSSPFSTQQLVISSHPTEIPDVDDDLNRELTFYKQCLKATRAARKILQKEGVPLARPVDYFAEMVKSDAHMDNIKSKMSADAVARKLATEARKQRDLKKFGKAVQVAKLQERDRARKDQLNAIQLLKRSRSPLRLTIRVGMVADKQCREKTRHGWWF